MVILSSLSLLLFGTATALWMRSIWFSDSIVSEILKEPPGRPTTYTDTVLNFWSGSLEVFRDVYVGRIESDGSRLRDEWQWLSGRRTASDVTPSWNTWVPSLWFHRLDHPPQPPAQPFGEHGYTIHAFIPYWTVLLVSGVAPICLFRSRLRKRRRLAAGRCLVCGYTSAARPLVAPNVVAQCRPSEGTTARRLFTAMSVL